MSTNRDGKIVSISALTAGALSLAIAVGCNQSQAAPQPAQKGAANAAATDAPAPAAGPKVDAEHYTAEIKGSGTYKAGQEGAVEVTLVPKGDYHINKQYPYKFKMVDPAPDGVTFPKPVLQRADGTFEEKRGSFKVPFVAAKAGKAIVKGTLSLSVCSEANCLMDKQDLELAVDVK